MAKKMKWLTEKEIGDRLIESDFFEGSEVHREFKIGKGVADFVSFYPNGIDVYELKITATVHSLFQVSNYVNDLRSQLFNSFRKRDAADNPNVGANIIARYIDNDVIDAAKFLNIAIFKISIDDKTGQINDIDLVSCKGLTQRLNDKELDLFLSKKFLGESQ